MGHRAYSSPGFAERATYAPQELPPGWNLSEPFDSARRTLKATSRLWREAAPGVGRIVGAGPAGCQPLPARAGFSGADHARPERRDDGP